MMTQNSKQSQNIKKKNKKSVSDFHNSCNVKERKRITLRKHNVIWKMGPQMESRIQNHPD